MLPNKNGSSEPGLVERGRELLSTWREAVMESAVNGRENAQQADLERAVATEDGATVDGTDADVVEASPAVAGASREEGEGPPAERVAREAYIEQLLDENSGRLWQREIVSLTDVSSSTVSRWLSALENDERIVRVRIGREKLVALPDEDLEAAAAPAPFGQAEE